MSALQWCTCQLPYTFQAPQEQSTVQSVADWRHQQGRPLQSEVLGAEAYIEENDGALTEENQKRMVEIMIVRKVFS